MNVLIIDGQGGALGKLLVKAVAERLPECAIRAKDPSIFDENTHI